VQQVVEALRPDAVLVEGPRDAQHLLPFLADDRTRSPVADYTTYRELVLDLYRSARHRRTSRLLHSVTLLGRRAAPDRHGRPYLPHPLRLPRPDLLLLGQLVKRLDGILGGSKLSTFNPRQG
jgi:hypothetical protein